MAGLELVKDGAWLAVDAEDELRRSPVVERKEWRVDMAQESVDGETSGMVKERVAERVSLAQEGKNDNRRPAATHFK